MKINTYLGSFNNHQELEAALKASKIEEYKKYSKMFADHPTMELSSLLSDLADTLNKRFGLDWNEIEALEA